MSAPVRIQLSRKRGWRMPPNTVRVARPGKWGNPFIVTDRVAPGKHFGAGIGVPTVEDAVGCFREYVKIKSDFREEAIRELRGKNLACFCALDQPCHADVLLELANAPICEEVGA